jgi:site-specific DNA-methyltransferase (adenine-specific)
MGKAWDGTGVAFRPDVWREALRVLKPGGYLLAFGGTRTYHRMAVAIEDAGFEIRDCIGWHYGSGFPKSLSVSSAIDKAARGTPQGSTKGDPLKRGKGVLPPREVLSMGGNNGGATTGLTDEYEEYVPATDDAKAWKGWGTALKPAWEPVVVARKPLEGTVAGNVLKHGTGAMNIDGCRVPTSDRLGGGHSSSGQQMSDGWRRPWVDDPEAVEANAARSRAAVEKAEALGRWPANIILSHDPACVEAGCAPGCPCTALDAQSDSASRFFNRLPIEEEDLVPFVYAAKASRKERNAGLPEETPCTHPTVKPVAVMRHLVRLVTRKGGVVLDPFMGSGTTGIAATLEGANFIGIDLSDEYLTIARARIAHHGGSPEVL